MEYIIPSTDTCVYSRWSLGIVNLDIESLIRVGLRSGRIGYVSTSRYL